MNHASPKKRFQRCVALSLGILMLVRAYAQMPTETERVGELQWLLGDPITEKRALRFDIATSATVLVAIDQLGTQITNAIRQAEIAGDYLLAQALRHALTAIAAYKQANKELLDKLFSSLDAQQRLFFDQIRSAVDAAGQSVDDALYRAQVVANTVAQAINDMPFGKKRVAVTDYSPKILVRQDPGTFGFTLTGLSLLDGKPEVVMPAAAQIERTELLLNSAKFRGMPFPSDNTNDAVDLNATIRLRQRRFLFSKKIDQGISFTILPQTLGTYSVTFRKQITQREYHPKRFERLVAFEGRDVTLSIAQTPVNPGYLIDCGSVIFECEKQEHANAPYPTYPCTPTGFAVSCHVNHRGWDGKKHAYSIVRFYWHEYRDQTSTETAAPVTGSVSAISDVIIPKPSGTFAVEGTFTDFKERAFRLQSAPLVELIDEPERIVIRPRKLHVTGM